MGSPAGRHGPPTHHRGASGCRPRASRLPQPPARSLSSRRRLRVESPPSWAEAPVIKPRLPWRRGPAPGSDSSLPPTPRNVGAPPPPARAAGSTWRKWGHGRLPPGPPRTRPAAGRRCSAANGHMPRFLPGGPPGDTGKGSVICRAGSLAGGVSLLSPGIKAGDSQLPHGVCRSLCTRLTSGHHTPSRRQAGGRPQWCRPLPRPRDRDGGGDTGSGLLGWIQILPSGSSAE